MPAAVFKLLPGSVTGGKGNGSADKASYILENSIVDIREGWMRTESRNLNFVGVLEVVEQQQYAVPASTAGANPGGSNANNTDVTTTVVFKSRLGERIREKTGQLASAREDGWLSGWMGALGAKGIQRSIESLASTKTQAQLGKSREGMLVVLERLRHTGVMGVLEMARRERARREAVGA
jgi:4-amino-4-deoxychorismate lyase